MEGVNVMESVTTLVGQVLTLTGDFIDYLMGEPILAIGVGVSIIGLLASCFKRASRAAR